MGGDSEAIIAENERELAAFASGATTTISPVLTRVLEEIRATGVPQYAWPHLRALLIAELELAMDAVAAADTSAATVTIGWSPTNKSRAGERRRSITDLLNTFDAPPFTLQRLTEVILDPTKSYKTLHKLINALEKLLAVSTTIPVADPRAVATPTAAAASNEPMESDAQPQAAPNSSDAAAASAPDSDVVARAPWSNSNSIADATS